MNPGEALKAPNLGGQVDEGPSRLRSVPPRSRGLMGKVTISLCARGGERVLSTMEGAAAQKSVP